MSLRFSLPVLLYPALTFMSVCAQTTLPPQLKPHTEDVKAIAATGATAEALPAKPDAILALLRRTNGLDLSGAKPWHVVAHYEVFDAEGKSVEKGTFEETYAGPQKFKRTYASDTTHQVDYGTDKGIFRSGDAKWPSFGAQGVPLLLADPLTFGPEAKGHSLTKGQHMLGAAKFDCVLIRPKEGSENPSLAPNADPAAVIAAAPVNAYAQYCTEPGHPLLRYSSGDRGTSAVSYNEPILFEDRYVFTNLMVVNALRKRLLVHVDTLDRPGDDALASLAPPAGTSGPLPAHVTLVSSAYPKAKIQEMPDTPVVARDQGVRGGAVVVNLTLSPDGHVTNVEPLFGPAILYPVAVTAAMKWRFQPVMMNGQPVEAEMLSVVGVGGGGRR